MYVPKYICLISDYSKNYILQQLRKKPTSIHMGPRIVPCGISSVRHLKNTVENKIIHQHNEIEVQLLHNQYRNDAGISAFAVKGLPQVSDQFKGKYNKGIL